MARHLKSGEDNKFFKVDRIGLTVAYREVGNQIQFGVSWRSDKDHKDSVKGRLVAMSRLEKWPLIIDNVQPGKERNQIMMRLADEFKGHWAYEGADTKNGLNISHSTRRKWNEFVNDPDSFIFKLINA